MEKSVKIITLLLLLTAYCSCSNEHKEYNKACKANTIEALKEFANNYPNSEYIDSAKSIIDSLIWQGVMNKDSLRGYEKFIDDHPKSKFLFAAKEIFDSLMWQDTKKNNTVDDYEIFIDEYPDSKYIDSAKFMFEKLK